MKLDNIIYQKIMLFENLLSDILLKHANIKIGPLLGLLVSLFYYKEGVIKESFKAL